MKILLARYNDNDDDTLGVFFFKTDNGDLQYVYSLEDEYRKDKVKGETRIPDGFYDIKLKKYGRFYDKYTNHKEKVIRDFTKKWGILQLQDVPNFDEVLIHMGNKDKDTAGCILVGMIPNNNSYEDGKIAMSTEAYIKLIMAVEEALENKEKIRIEVRDFDREIERSL